MSVPHDFNAKRVARATSERAFTLGPFTFKRRMSVPPEVIAGFRESVTESGDDDRKHIVSAETLIASVTEGNAVRTADGTVVPFADAWRFLRFEGDEYGVLDIDDLLSLSRWLVEGAVERPTGSPSDSSNGSPTPATGMISTGISPSAEPASTISTPDGLSMRPTPA